MGSTLRFDGAGWLTGMVRGLPVVRVPTERTVPLDGPVQGVVWHWTAGYGSARTLARLYAKRDSPAVLGASFHFGIDRGNGQITQLAPITRGTQHCRGRLPGGRVVNNATIGVELVNVGRVMRVGAGWVQVENPHDPPALHRPTPGVHVVPADVVEAHGGHWQRYTEAQIEVAQTLVDALAEAGVPTEHWGHYELEPGRKADPGPLWMTDVVRAGRLLPLVAPNPSPESSA